MDNGRIVNSLNNLIVVLKDADLGFHAAAEEVRDTGLKTRLHEHGQSCSTMWGELQHEVRSIGGEPEREGTFSGKCRRIWTEIKTAFTDKDEYVVLKDVVSAQQSVQEEFNDVLETEGFPSNLKMVVGRHYQTVREITDEVQAQHERFDAIQNA